MTDDHHNDQADRVQAGIAGRAFAPHCDQKVLHAPGACWVCDGYPDWQAARVVWGINFTGEIHEDKLPCPAEYVREVEKIHRWGGNRPVTTEALVANPEEMFFPAWRELVPKRLDVSISSAPTLRQRLRRLILGGSS